jgi:hypothetical protein
MPNPGQVEVTVRFDALPGGIETFVDGGAAFAIHCGHVAVAVRLGPVAWRKMTEGAATYPRWEARVRGRLGARTSTGFALEECTVQVFERRPRAPPVEEPPG